MIQQEIFLLYLRIKTDNRRIFELMKTIHKIDLHMHSTVSDGTDTPEEILAKIRAAGIDLFSLTDHDALKGCTAIMEKLGPDDPMFITGVEFSCRDKLGKYHILGYAYDPGAAAICSLVETGHNKRMEKLKARLEALRTLFGIVFSEEDISQLFSQNNPGKPHIANLMVKHGYAPDIKTAFSEYLNRAQVQIRQCQPEEAITAVLQSGGIPVLAHPSYGSGDELIIGEEMDERLQRLISFGLQGVEGYYTGFTPALQAEILGLAEKYDLYVTAGSDYHGKNKMISLGDHPLEDAGSAPRGLQRFLDDVLSR